MEDLVVDLMILNRHEEKLIKICVLVLILGGFIKNMHVFLCYRCLEPISRFYFFRIAN
jgi:hypothetical protein